MIAAFPMYDRPELADTWDHLWQLFREAYCDGPNELSRDGDLWDLWENPDLLLAQTCGFPYRTKLKDRVTLIGAPDYGLSKVPAGHYCSVLVVHKDRTGVPLTDFDGAALAFNDTLSQSGWAAVWRHFDDHALRIGTRLQSGSHRASARLVAQKQADFAALDIVSWTLIRRYDDFADDLTVMETTVPTPALPFITATYRDPKPIFRALSSAIQALTQGQQDDLLLRGLVALPQSAYEAVPNPPKP